MNLSLIFWVAVILTSTAKISDNIFILVNNTLPQQPIQMIQIVAIWYYLLHSIQSKILNL